jgi:hypothetical protein
MTGGTFRTCTKVRTDHVPKYVRYQTKRWEWHRASWKLRLFTPDSIISISTHCAGVQSLNLWGCRNIIDATNKSIYIFCTRLQSLNCDSAVAVQYSRTGLPMYHHPKEPLVMSIQYTTCLIWYYYVTHMSSVMSLKDLPFFMRIWIRSFTCVRCPPKILFGIISYLNIVLTWSLACFLL